MTPRLDARAPSGGDLARAHDTCVVSRFPHHARHQRYAHFTDNKETASFRFNQYVSSYLTFSAL